MAYVILCETRNKYHGDQMAMNKPQDIQGILNVLRSSQSSDDDLCDAVRELMLLQPHDKSVTEVLLERIENRIDPFWVRKQLVAALGGTILPADPMMAHVANLMQQILESSEESEDVRGMAAIALGVFAVPDFAESIVNTLEKEMVTNHTGLMVSCVTALKMLKQPIAINVLERALNLGIPPLTITSAEALGVFGPLAKDALPTLSKIVVSGNDPERQAALSAIEEIKK